MAKTKRTRRRFTKPALGAGCNSSPRALRWPQGTWSSCLLAALLANAGSPLSGTYFMCQ